MALPTVGRAIFALASGSHLDGPNDSRFVVNAASLATGLAAHERLVHLDGVSTPKGVTVGAHHARAQLVQDRERRLVAANAELALELEGGLPRGLRRDEVRAPEPRREGRVGGLHDGARRERDVGPASPAAQDDRRPLGEAVGLAHLAALGAHEAVGPAQCFQILSASILIGENALELGKGRRETTRVHTENLASLRFFGKEPDKHGFDDGPKSNLLIVQDRRVCLKIGRNQH